MREIRIIPVTTPVLFDGIVRQDFFAADSTAKKNLALRARKAVPANVRISKKSTVRACKRLPLSATAATRRTVVV